MTPRERRQLYRIRDTPGPGMRSTAKRSMGRGRTQHQTKSCSPAGKQEEPGAQGGALHAMPHTLCVHTGLQVCSCTADEGSCEVCLPHVCPVVVPAACLHTHIPRLRVTTSNVNVRAGLLLLQAHESFSSSNGNLWITCREWQTHVCSDSTLSQWVCGRIQGTRSSSSSQLCSSWGNSRSNSCHCTEPTGLHQSYESSMAGTP